MNTPPVTAPLSAGCQETVKRNLLLACLHLTQSMLLRLRLLCSLFHPHEHASVCSAFTSLSYFPLLSLSFLSLWTRVWLSKSEYDFISTVQCRQVRFIHDFAVFVVVAGGRERCLPAQCPKHLTTVSFTSSCSTDVPLSLSLSLFVSRMPLQSFFYSFYDHINTIDRSERERESAMERTVEKI